MARKNSKLKSAQMQAKAALNKTNKKINELGEHTGGLYEKINTIQGIFDSIRNVPSDKKLQHDKIKEIRLNWKQQADKIEKDFKTAKVKSAGGGVAGVGAGVAVAALGPTAPMGVATTFGVASTGTAISALSGAAATNAALAWLGGGALAAGGGGMAAGSAFLALAGPIGWAIAGVALISSGLMFWKTKSDQKRIEDIFTLISERDKKSYDLATVELNERIARIKNESGLLGDAIEKIQTFGTDYNQMTEAQQYELGSYVNLMEASTQLLVNPILGLQPKYTESDFEDFSSEGILYIYDFMRDKYRNVVITLANLLYKISLDDKDKKLLAKSFNNNKEFLKAMGLDKKDIGMFVFDTVTECLAVKYSQEKKA